MPTKKQIKTQSKPRRGGGPKVELPRMLDPAIALYQSPFFKACYYVSRILMDLSFSQTDQFPTAEQLKIEMNNVTAEENYENIPLGVTDAATNTQNINIVVQYDPHLICWFNFHSLMLFNHNQVVVKMSLKKTENWAREVRTKAWYVLFVTYKRIITDHADYPRSVYLDTSLAKLESKITFPKYCAEFDNKQVLTFEVMTRLKGRLSTWADLKYYLYLQSSDLNNDKFLDSNSDDEPIKKENTSTGRTLAGHNSEVDNTLEFKETQTPNLLTRSEQQHNLRSLLVSLDHDNLRAIEKILLRKYTLNRTRSKLERELAKVNKELDEVKVRFTTNRSNLYSTLDSQLQPSGNSQPIADMLTDLGRSMPIEEQIDKLIKKMEVHKKKYSLMYPKQIAYPFDKFSVPPHLLIKPEQTRLLRKT